MSTTFWRDEPTVFAVDRDAAFCQTLRHAARGLGFSVEVHAAWEDLIDAVDHGRHGCVVMDPCLPRCGTAELIAGLADQGIHLPVVVVSTLGDVPHVVQAMRAGALNYLQKPCEAEPLAAALQEAVAWDAEHSRPLAEAARFRRRLGRLTPGERQLLELLVHGMTNQEAAVELGLSVRAVEVRRAKIREKMRTKNLAELVRHLVADRDTDSSRKPQPIG